MSKRPHQERQLEAAALVQTVPAGLAIAQPEPRGRALIALLRLARRSVLTWCARWNLWSCDRPMNAWW